MTIPTFLNKCTIASGIGLIGNVRTDIPCGVEYRISADNRFVTVLCYVRNEVYGEDDFFPRAGYYVTLQNVCPAAVVAPEFLITQAPVPLLGTGFLLLICRPTAEAA